MTVPWKAWKTKYGFFHASHRPLKIPQNRRDFHIPTAQACTAWKSGKPTTGFPLSHPVHAMTTTVLSLNRKTKRKEVGRYAASSFLYAALPPVERNRFHAHPSIGKCSAGCSESPDPLMAPFPCETTA